MKKIVTSKLFIAIIGILCLSTLVWFVGPLIAIAGSVPLESMGARFGVIIAVILIWACVTAWKQWQIKRANQMILDEIVEQPDSGSDSASQEEVAQLSERFRESISMLKKSDSETGGDLYAMPWYIIIGPPGAGKTTALVNSGLRFPLAERMGQQSLQGVGGTRDCDWWFTEEAVLIDTAGRYVTQDSSQEVDSSAWEGFLNLLKKHRKRRPINGAIVAISILDVMTQNPSERQHHAAAIKARLSELKSRLGMDVPVYVLITKCDLISGFAEFFEDLGNKEREQVWGMTFPLLEDFSSIDYVQEFNKEYRGLLDRLNGRLLWRMHSERDLQRSALIYGFPQQMATLQETLSGFLEEVFSKTRFDEQHLVRGVYFCSGVQEGRPIDRVLGALSRSFGLAASENSISGAKGRSYFLTDLFKEIVFPEQGVGAVNRKLERQRAWGQKAAYVGVVALLGVLGFLWSMSFARNGYYLLDMSDKLETFEEINADVAGSSIINEPTVAPAVDALLEVKNTFSEVNEDVPFLMGMGLYQGHKLTETAEQAARRYLNRYVMPLVVGRIEDITRLGADQPDLLYEVLKVYLMLGNPERLDKENLHFWMQLAWSDAYGAGEPTTQSMIAALDEMQSLGLSAQPIDDRLVERSRRILNSVDEVELHYLIFRGSVVESAGVQQLGFDQIASIQGVPLFSRQSGKPVESGIPLLYTAEGKELFEEEQLDQIVDAIKNESWVLGDDSNAENYDSSELKDQLLSYYYTDYIRYWEELLRDLEIASMGDLDQAIDALEVLSGNRSPLKKILLSVEQNTNLATKSLLDKAPSGTLDALKKGRLQQLLGASSDAADKVIDEKPEDAVTRRFEDLNFVVQKSETGAAPIESLLRLLSEYYAFLVEVRDSRGTPVAQVEKSSASIERRIRTEAARQPEPLRGWLTQLIYESRRAVFRQAGGNVSRQYSSVIGPACDRSIRGRFPVYSNAEREVTIADFEQFFGNGGIMDSFYKQNLASLVDTSAGTWRWNPETAGDMGLGDGMLRQFEYAAKIRKAFFPQGGNQLQVKFGLRPTYLDSNVRQVLLDFGDQQLRYRHGPSRVTWFTWPNDLSANGFSVTFDDASGARKVYREKGQWAMFNALRKSDTTTQRGDKVQVEFNVDGRKASFELSASSVVNPFNLPELRRFSCGG